MSRKVIRKDQTFDKVLTDHVKKDGRVTLCFSIRGNQAVISGEKRSVQFATENVDKVTLVDLLEAMKSVDKEDKDVKEYKTTERVEFPPMDVKFKGQLWTHKKARSYLTTCLNILGFGKGGTKSFQNPDDEPEGWPEEHSFQKLGHPSHATLDVSNDIIISLLSFHGFDADTHPFEAIEPEPAPKKRKKSQKATTFIEDEEQKMRLILMIIAFMTNLKEKAREEEMMRNLVIRIWMIFLNKKSLMSPSGRKLENKISERGRLQ